MGTGNQFHKQIILFLNFLVLCPYKQKFYLLFNPPDFTTFPAVSLLNLLLELCHFQETPHKDVTLVRDTTQLCGLCCCHFISKAPDLSPFRVSHYSLTPDSAPGGSACCPDRAAGPALCCVLTDLLSQEASQVSAGDHTGTEQGQAGVEVARQWAVSSGGRRFAGREVGGGRGSQPGAQGRVF